MLKPKSVLVLGLWLLLVSFLGTGLPSYWQSVLYIATGIYLILKFLFFVVKRETRGTSSRGSDTFVENGDIINSSKQ